MSISTVTFSIGSIIVLKYQAMGYKFNKFLRSLPPAWSNLAMTMRTNPKIDTLSIDDLYNNLRVFEQEIQGICTPSTLPTNIS
ncbi:hypothetical protein Tco_0205343 [Tanacetum coccineum]